MAASASNLIAGPGTLWIAAFGATEPADSNVSSTFSASGWTDIGATTDGVTLTWEREFFEYEMDQIIDVPARKEIKRNMQVKTNMAEPTLANLKYALNGGTVTASASYSTYDPDTSAVNSSTTYWALVFVGAAPGGFNRRAFVRKALSIESVEAPYQKDNQTVW